MTAIILKKIAPVFCFTLLLSCFTNLPGQKLWGQEQEPETGQEIHELNAGFYYTIKKGDTLWDLSERFFDSPWIWPDMWEKNRDISNPHWIYPGDKIRVYSREGMDSKTFMKKGAERGTLDTDTGKEEIQEAFYFYPPIDSVGFIKKDPIVPSGRIFRARLVEKEIIGEGDTVYVRPEPGKTFKTGERYTIFRTSKSYKHEDTKAFIGKQHVMVGILDIFEVHQGIATAMVYRSFRNIEIDDMVTPYQARSPKIPITRSTEGIRGRLLDNEEDNHHFGDQAIVYIDKGRNDGIKVGQYYTMFYQDEEKFGSGKGREFVTLAPVNKGELLILHTEDTSSSCVITAIHDYIEAGMQIRTP
jgi:hypothetical protein